MGSWWTSVHRWRSRRAWPCGTQAGTGSLTTCLNAKHFLQGLDRSLAVSLPGLMIKLLVLFGSFRREEQMGEFVDKAKGKLKQVVADLTGDKKLKRQGQKDEIKGNLKGAAAGAKRVVKNAAKDAKRVMKDASR